MRLLALRDLEALLHDWGLLALQTGPTHEDRHGARRLDLLAVDAAGMGDMGRAGAQWYRHLSGHAVVRTRTGREGSAKACTPAAIAKLPPAAQPDLRRVHLAVEVMVGVPGPGEVVPELNDY